LGFSTFHRPCLRRFGRRREHAAAASRRAREEPGAGPELRERITGVDHYTARDDVFNRRLWKERRPTASGKGAGPEQGHLHRREHLLRHATAHPRAGYDYTAAPT
jgi:hypothetical protein